MKPGDLIRTTWSGGQECLALWPESSVRHVPGSKPNSFYTSELGLVLEYRRWGDYGEAEVRVLTNRGLVGWIRADYTMRVAR